MRAVAAALRASSLAIRALSAVSRRLPFLSKGFERLAMMITNLTRFLSEWPELFHLVPGSLRGGAVFRSLTDQFVVTAFVHDITYYHDGRAATLTDVVAHYNRVRNIGLTMDQQQAPVEYLKSR